MGGHKTDGDSEQIPLLEWVAAAFGLLIVVGMLAFLALEALGTSSKVPPLMRVEPTRLAAAPGQHVVEVKVTNRSGQTGAGVQIEGVLKRGGEDVETSNATIDYIPGHSERRGGLIFTRDPRKYQLELRVTGYQRP